MMRFKDTTWTKGREIEWNRIDKCTLMIPNGKLLCCSTTEHKKVSYSYLKVGFIYFFDTNELF